MAQVLITGGTGFIGSHCCLALLQRGHSVRVLDSFASSGPEPLRRVAELAGLSACASAGDDEWAWSEPDGTRPLSLLRGDVRSSRDLERAFVAPMPAPGAEGVSRPIDAVVHFAGLKAVPESVIDPLRYWDVNLGGTRALLAAMRQHGCRTFVFSSSATLYGVSAPVPIPESAPVRPINPYGHTKAAVERMLADLAGSEPGWRIACLRYFNPVGAHPSGRIGEDPRGLASNLFPLISQVAVGRRPRLQVFGTDWPTPDGTGVRDFVHVMDLAEGHGTALELMLREPPQQLTLNLGSGRGHSVLELLAAFASASGRPIPWSAAPRRAGDTAISIADPSEAERRLGWRTHRSLEDICRDGWAWQCANPEGYGPD